MGIVPVHLGQPARSMGEALGGRGKRRRNIAQKHGGAKDGGGVNTAARTSPLPPPLPGGPAARYTGHPVPKVAVGPAPRPSSTRIAHADLAHDTSTHPSGSSLACISCPHASHPERPAPTCHRPPSTAKAASGDFPAGKAAAAASACGTIFLAFHLKGNISPWPSRGKCDRGCD